MKKKLFGRIIGIVLILQVLLVGTCVVASANNCKDTDVTWTIIDGANSYTNSVRLKTDTTHSYQRCISTPYTYQSWVYGYNVNTNVMNTDLSHGHHYTFNSGTVYWMLNWVLEEGYTHAGMAANSQSGQNFIATAVWSPDSV